MKTGPDMGGTDGHMWTDGFGQALEASLIYRNRLYKRPSVPSVPSVPKEQRG
jgi:hypothetical protein